MKRIIAVLCVFTCFAVATVFTQTVSWRYVFANQSPLGRKFPGLKTMSNGTTVLTFGTSGSGMSVDMFVCTSTNAGETWSTPSKFVSVNNAMLGLQRRPRVLVDKVGRYHAVFEDAREDQMTKAYHCYSTDNGTTWSSPKAVVTVVKNSMEDFIDAAIDSSNNVVVSFLSSGYDAADILTHVYLVKSSNSGVTWTQPLRVDRFVKGGSCECCQQNIDVSPTGKIVVAFRSNISNRRDIHVAVMSNTDTIFQPPVLIQSEPWHIDGCPTQGPSVTFDATENIHIAWVDARDSRNAPVAYYAKLQADQTTTPENVDLSSALSGTTTYPSVSASPSGSDVVVAWEGSKGVSTAISSDGGNEFQRMILDDMTVHNANVCTSFLNAKPRIIWQANRDGVFDLRMSDATTSAEEAEPVEQRVWFTADGLLHIVANGDVASVCAWDILGRIVPVHAVSNDGSLYKVERSGMVFVQINVNGQYYTQTLMTR